VGRTWATVGSSSTADAFGCVSWKRRGGIGATGLAGSLCATAECVSAIGSGSRTRFSLSEVLDARDEKENGTEEDVGRWNEDCEASTRTRLAMDGCGRREKEKRRGASTRSRASSLLSNPNVDHNGDSAQFSHVLVCTLEPADAAALSWSGASGQSPNRCAVSVPGGISLTRRRQNRFSRNIPRCQPRLLPLTLVSARSSRQTWTQWTLLLLSCVRGEQSDDEGIRTNAPPSKKRLGDWKMRLRDWQGLLETWLEVRQASAVECPCPVDNLQQHSRRRERRSHRQPR
jgi:hypothetical protein